MVSDNKKMYKKNFLTNVIFKVDFPKVLELTDKKSPIEFQKKISDSFPILNEVKGGQFEYEIKSTNQFSLKSEDKISWEFMSKDKTKKVFVDSDYVYLECLRYEHFEDFFKDIKLVFETFLELYPIKIAKRIGLRYINQIKLDTGDPLDWSDFIDNNLFSVTANFLKNKDSLLKSMQLLEVKEDEFILKFQFGFFNSEYPNPIARKEFVLDYDCISNEETEINDIYTISKKFNEIIEKWFETSILDGLRDIMEDKNEN